MQPRRADVQALLTAFRIQTSDAILSANRQAPPAPADLRAQLAELHSAVGHHLGMELNPPPPQ